MDIPTKIRVPDYVYRFYKEAAQSVAGQSAEQLMADALSAYAALLDQDMKKTRNTSLEREGRKYSGR